MRRSPPTTTATSPQTRRARAAPRRTRRKRTASTLRRRWRFKRTTERLLICTGAALFRGGMTRAVSLVGLDHGLDQLVANDVPLVEVDERDASNAAQDRDRLHEPRDLARGQV